jgi:hypothetical protein
VEDKAKEDSEDVLTPMLAENAEIVVIAALRFYADELAQQKKNIQEKEKEKESNQTAAQEKVQQVAIHKAGDQAVNGGGQ